MPLIKKLRSEDDVRNNADTILGFSDGEANVNQGTGQITTFNQLGYSNHSLKSHKPDGWYIPDDLANLPQPTEKQKTPVDTSDWGEFVVGELFDCNTTKTFYPNKSELPEGNTPYITRSTYDNGISGYYDDINNEFTIEGNCLTIGAEGGIAFWQPKPFIAGVKVYTIRHPHLNELTALFIASILNTNSANYSYTNARVLAKIKAESIKLPLKPSTDPSNYTQKDIDWAYMEKVMQTIEEKAQNHLKTLQKTIA